MEAQADPIFSSSLI